MEFLDEDILNEAEKELQRIVEEYEAYLSSKFNTHATGSSSVFYNYLNHKTKEVQEKCYNVLVNCFKELCAAASIPLFRGVFNLFKKSVSSYLKEAFGQYKSVYTSLFSKYREQLSEETLRSSLFKDILKAKGNIKKFMLGREDVVISVGKRSFHLSNYLRIVAEQEIRQKFVYSTLMLAKKEGAIGIRISDHNTKTKLCELYEGKTYLFKNNGLAALKNGLPPFHVNCKHFIIPVYANN